MDFDSDIPLAILFTRENLDYCCKNDYKTKVTNCFKGVLKDMFFFQQIKKHVLFRSKNPEILPDDIKMI